MSYGMQGNRGPTGAVAGQKLAGGFKLGQKPNFTPEQMQLFQSLFSQVSPDSYTSRLAGGDQSLFEEMEAPALRQFGNIQANTANRFSGMGSGARRSSGFQNEIGAQGANFSEQLQSRRQELQRNAIKDLLGMSEDLLGQKPYENYMIKPQKKRSFFEKLMGGALPLAGAAAGGFFGGPEGALMGGRAGRLAGSGFY